MSQQGPLVLEVRPDADAPQVVARGEIDVATAPRLRQALFEAARRTDARIVVVDMEAVVFCDARGLRVFTEVNRVLGTEGRRVALRSPRAMLRRVLDIMSLADDLLEDDL